MLYIYWTTCRREGLVQRNTGINFYSLPKKCLKMSCPPPPPFFSVFFVFLSFFLSFSSSFLCFSFLSFLFVFFFSFLFVQRSFFELLQLSVV